MVATETMAGTEQVEEAPSVSHLQCLKNTFGLPSFRGSQYAAVKATLDGRCCSSAM